jgi:hypothetical protein
MNFDPVLGVLFLIAIGIFVWLDLRKKPDAPRRPPTVDQVADIVVTSASKDRSVVFSITIAGAMWVEREVTVWRSVHDGAIEIDADRVDALIVRANRDGLRVVVH